MINTTSLNDKNYNSINRNDDWNGGYYLTDNFSKFEQLEKLKESSQDLSLLYKQSKNGDDVKRAKRMSDCCRALLLVKNDKKKWRHHTNHCRVRYCPICQANRSKKHQAIFYKNISKVMEKYPNGRWLFLTLTAKNCHVTDLRATLKGMNAAFRRMTGFVDFKRDILGFIKVVEFTRPVKAPMDVHPHFHVLLFVKSSYFKGKRYISKQKWINMWKRALDVNYFPIVDVKAIKTDTSGDLENNKRLLGYVFKYAVKPAEAMRLDCSDDKNLEWFAEMTKQTHKMRFVSKGGILRDVFQAEELEEDDRALDRLRLQFNWDKGDSKYTFNEMLTRYHLEELNKEREERIKLLESQALQSAEIVNLLEYLRERIEQTKDKLNE